MSVETRPPTVGALIDAYSPGASFFASPRGALLAEAPAAFPGAERVRTAAAGAGAALDRAVAAGCVRPVVVGALPFAAPARPHLLLASSPLRAWGTDDRPVPGWPPAAAPLVVRPHPDRAGYADAVAGALRRIADGGLDKVVLARTLRLEYAEPVAVTGLLRRLVRRNAHAYTYAVELPGPAGAAALVGASPELLVAKHGVAVESWPLAGSAPRSRDPVEDRAAAAALMSSEKDLREHAYVVDAVAAALRPYCATLDVPARPALTATPALWHLGTRITGELADPGVSSLELAAALHPTPAVCGWPAGAARAAIDELEPFDRGFYAGAVGWCDAAGDGEWAVAIRCAEVAGRSVRLFAGAGVVGGSTPRGEVDETSAKFRTALAALGVEPVARSW